jgi:iron(III) transport system substrate-binding protein
MRTRCVLAGLALVIAIGLAPQEWAGAQPSALTVYSGRAQPLVGPLLEQFGRAAGVQVRARYGETAAIAATIMEEGPNSPADVYFAQDAGALGYLAYTGRLRRLPDAVLQRVESRFRSADGLWVGVSGRARVLVYNTRRVAPRGLPESITDLTAMRWRGRVGWAPTNGSFQAHTTAMRLVWGNERTRRWLEAMRANGARAYPSNPAIVAAVGTGEVEVGLVNNYYLFQFLRERGEVFPVRNHMFKGDDIGNLVNVAGVGIVDTSRNPAAAQRLVEFLLSPEAQRYFAAETYEYPLVREVSAHPMLVPLAQIQTPRVDLNYLQALDATLRMLREVGLL